MNDGIVLKLRPAQVGQHPNNIRDSSRDLAALASSIKEVGVLVPLIVVPVGLLEGDWPAEVTHVALDGNRRQAAAAQVGAELPCIVDTGTTPALRTQTMVVTNLARDGLTAREHAAAVQTMLDLGISQAAIARTTGMKPKAVKTAKAAASLGDSFTEFVEHHDLTLDQLAVLAEYQNDPDATAGLLDAVPRGRFDHALAQIVREKKAAAAAAKRVEELRAAGVHVLDTRPEHGSGPVELHYLAAPSGSDNYSLPAEAHTSCPGRAIWTSTTYAGEVYEQEYCLDPAGNGHTLLYPGRGGGGGEGPKTEEAAATEKQERKELIRRNKEMAAAQDVRFDFITRVWAAKEHAKEIAAWALGRVVAGNGTFVRWAGDYRGMRGLDRILGTETPGKYVTEAPEFKHPTLLWAMVCAAFESEFNKDAWRSPDRSRADYLTHLVSLGYVPCETEQLLIDGAPTDVVEDEDLDDDLVAES